MESDEGIVNVLRHGSKDEIGRAITRLSRLKDPGCSELLKGIMNSDDPFLSTMAAYAIGEAGDKEGFRYLEKLLQSASGIFPHLNQNHDLKVIEEVLRLPDTINNAFDLYNSSYFIESKGKLLKILDIYSLTPPKMNVPYFDDLIAFTVKKTRGLILDAIAVCEFSLGNVEDAMKYSLEAIGIAQEVNDPQLLKIAYADLGHIHMSLGNYYSALELLQESLAIDESSHDPWRKRNRILSNLSQLYYLIGQYEKALEHIHEALELSEKENDLIGKAKGLNAKGVILCNVNEFGNAEECLQEALRLSVNELNNKSLQGLILNNISFLYYSSSELVKAKAYLSDALELSVQMSDKSTEGLILSGMAILEIESGNIDDASRLAESALNISLDTHNLSGQADAKYILGSIEDSFNDNSYMAHNHYKEAIAISETLRKNLMLDDFKISFAGNYTAVYQQMISLCIRMGKVEDAFEYIERSKSRALVDMLSSTSNAIGSKTVSSEDIKEIVNLKGKLDILRKQLGVSHSYLDKESSDIRQDGIKEELTEIERTYKKTFEELKIKDPEWTSLVSVDVVNLKAVQDILPDDTLLLELHQSGDELIILPVRKNSHPSVVRIPVNINSDPERLYNLFTAISNGSGIDTRSHEYIKHIKQPLSYFYDLFISPLSELTEDIKHLIIIPHYFWHYLPFHALYDNKSKEHLIDRLSISYAPSATVLSQCLKKNDNKYRSALLLANSSNDLPYAEEEVERIKAKIANNACLFKGKQASFDKLSAYRESDIIHLACHGYFRGDEPLFSHLVFSDSEGKEAPFFLPDIFNLKLKSSLVTLSACETGLSQFTAGDELIGISRGFFYAGSPALLASQWIVNDKSTALLMDNFYEELVNKGRTKAEALRNAIGELKAIPEYSHPYFWAPFFLSGDWG